MSLNLDLTNVKNETPKQKYEPVTEGWYCVEAEDAEVKETKDGTGEYVKVKFRITSGPFEGRVVYNNFNIKNKNDKAVQIGMSQLKKFMGATGLLDCEKLANVGDLCGKAVAAKLKIRRDETWGDSNVVTSFRPVAIAPTTNAMQDDIPF